MAGPLFPFLHALLNKGCLYVELFMSRGNVENVILVDFKKVNFDNDVFFSMFLLKLTKKYIIYVNRNVVWLFTFFGKWMTPITWHSKEAECHYTKKPWIMIITECHSGYNGRKTIYFIFGTFELQQWVRLAQRL